jgi:hypothetical protein
MAHLLVHTHLFNPSMSSKVPERHIPQEISHLLTAYIQRAAKLGAYSLGLFKVYTNSCNRFRFLKQN